MRDLGSSGKTYINGAPIPPNRDIRKLNDDYEKVVHVIKYTILLAELNDRDLVSLGQCIDREEARDQKRCFLYQVHAPTDWSELGGGHVDSDEETDDGGGGISDETASAAESPPPDAAAIQVIEVDSPPHNLPDVVKNIKKEEDSEINLESSSSSMEVAENVVECDSSESSPKRHIKTEPTPSTSKTSPKAKPTASTSKTLATKRKASTEEMGGRQHKRSKGEDNSSEKCASSDDYDDDLFSHVRGKSIKQKNVKPEKSLKSSQAEEEDERDGRVVEEVEEDVDEKEEMNFENVDDNEGDDVKELEIEGDFVPQRTSSKKSTKRGHRSARLMDSSEDEHDEDLLNCANRKQARSLRGRRLSGSMYAKIPKVSLERLERPRGATSAVISGDGKSVLRWMRWTVHKMTSPDALNEPLFEYEGDDVNVKDEVASGKSDQKKKKLSQLSSSDSSSPLVSSHTEESSLEEGEIGEMKRGKARCRKKKRRKRSIGKSFEPSSSSEEEGECEPPLSTKGLNFSQIEEVIEVS